MSAWRSQKLPADDAAAGHAVTCCPLHASASVPCVSLPSPPPPQLPLSRLPAAACTATAAAGVQLASNGGLVFEKGSSDVLGEGREVAEVLQVNARAHPALLLQGHQVSGGCCLVGARVHTPIN